MEELHFTGNCLKGSRPILSFDAAFDSQPYLQVIKELFLHQFGVPQGARKSKPFVDHVMGFTFADGKIWVRNYQISEVDASKAKEGETGALELPAKSDKGRGNKETDIQLIEIGPRFVLTPIVIQEGSFGGPIIYENKEFISPNQGRADLRRRTVTKHNARSEQYAERRSRTGELGLRTSYLDRLHALPVYDLKTNAGIKCAYVPFRWLILTASSASSSSSRTGARTPTFCGSPTTGSTTAS